MTHDKNNSYKLGLTLGILGFIAGIALLFGENKFIGIAGSVASAGLIIKGLKDRKALKEADESK